MTTPHIIYKAIILLSPTGPIFLGNHFNPQNINFLIRSKIQELAQYSAKNLAISLKDNQQLAAKFDESQNFAIYGKRSGKLVAICICGEKVSVFPYLKDMIAQVQAKRGWSEVKFDCNFIDLKDFEVQQTGLSELQKELEETKNLVYENLENVIKRGENIDEIYAKTIDLSDGAKQFLQASKKMRCRCLGM